MNGLNVLTRCPYCGKLIYKNIGGTNYYNYKGDTVRVESHENCGKFITTDYSYELDMFYPPKDGGDLETCVKYNKFFRPIIFRYIFENYKKNTLVEEYVENIMKEIKEKYGQKYSEEEIEFFRKKIVSSVIELLIKREEFDNDLFIAKLTEDVEKDLIYESTIMW